MPNITGHQVSAQVPIFHINGGFGALYPNSLYDKEFSAQSKTVNTDAANVMYFDASRYNNIYKNAGKVTPLSRKTTFVIKY